MLVKEPGEHRTSPGQEQTISLTEKKKERVFGFFALSEEVSAVSLCAQTSGESLLCA